MSVEKLPVFVLQNEYFDKLRNPIDISLYSFIEKLWYQGKAVDEKDISKFCKKMKITEQEMEESCNHLVSINFLTLKN